MDAPDEVRLDGFEDNETLVVESTGVPPLRERRGRTLTNDLAPSAQPDASRRAETETEANLPARLNRQFDRLRELTAAAWADAASTRGEKDKQTIDDLAIFGGPPAFSESRHVGRPNMGDRGCFHRLVDEIWDRKYLSNDGPTVREFERRVAGVAAVRHAVAVTNATVGLELTVRALGLSGDVIVPAMTFVATAHALHWLGLNPVFADVDPITHCLDPTSVEQSITERTSAIIGVHLWGSACEVQALEDIASRRGLRLIFDAAHAFGCSHRGIPVGRHGDAEVFSFHASKFVHSCEGGVIATNDSELADRLRRMRNFGFTGIDQVDSPGTNAKMHEVSAAMGVVSIEAMPEFIAINRRNYARYIRGIEGIRGLTLLAPPKRESHNFQYVVAECDADEFGMTRDSLVESLRAEQVLARRYFFPGVHRMAPYRDQPGADSRRLPVAERLVERLVSFPTGAAMTADDVDRVCRLLRFIHQNAAAIQERRGV